MFDLYDLAATPSVMNEVRRFVRLISRMEPGGAAALTDYIVAIAAGASFTPAPTMPPRNWSTVGLPDAAADVAVNVLGRVSGDDQASRY